MIIGKKIGIYKITNPKGAVYIGQSRDISKRRTSYRGISKKNKGQPKLYNSLLKYGAENHTFEILEECELSQLNIKERYWQDLYDACSRYNLNCTLTSTDEIPQMVSEETRKKLSQAAKVRMATRTKDPVWMETMRLAGIKKRGKKLPPKTDAQKEAKRQDEIRKGNWKGEKNPWFGVDRSGEKNTRWGAVPTQETRDKISKANKGRKYSEEPRKKMIGRSAGGNNAHAKLILNIENGVYFDCIKHAFESQTRFAYTTIKGKLNGGCKTNDTPFIYA